MSDKRTALFTGLMEAEGLDAVALVPGANFRRAFGKDFYQNERPIVVVLQGKGPSLAIVPALEKASFDAIDFDGELFIWRDQDGYDDAFTAMAPKLVAGRLGVEGQRMRVFEHHALKRAAPALEIVDAHEAISSLRLHKTAAEIASLRKAIAISEAALDHTLNEVRVGMTETTVEGLLLRNLFQAGAEGLSFAPIVAAGDNSYKPHAKARRDYAIKPGDALLFDFGAAFDGMNADITRTVFVKHCSDRARDIYETVLIANRTGRELAHPGMTAHDLDDQVSRTLESSAFKQLVRHKTGHGLGLDVHEAPQIMRGNHAKLEPGMVFTIEPGLYAPGELGVRIEDNVVVTDDGNDCLTSFSRDLRVVG